MKRGMTTAVAAGVALATLFLGIPAGAEEADQMVSDTLGSSTAATSESVPENPSQKLPDEVADSVPEDSTLVSPSLATDSDGTVYDVQTGTEVTDPALVGTDEAPADPLAKTDGESFIPVDISDVKEKVEGNSGAAQSGTGSDSHSGSADSGASVQNSRFVASAAARVWPTFLDNNSYGAHWGTYNGTPAFFENNGNLFVQQAQGVIDISQWQGDINWDAVKATGNVQGVIVRLGYGHDNALDTKAARNISELRRLGIPFGVYWYSYSADAGFSTQEARSTVAALRQLGIQPGELKYPVYYDMERWTWKGHAPSTNPNVNAAAMRAYISTLNASGYTNVDVYSYTSYLNSALKHNDIWRKTTWVAQYGARMGFTAWNTNFRGWQYSSTGHVNGISGNVDINAFGNREYSGDNTRIDNLSRYPIVAIPNGIYYLNSTLNDSVSIDIPNESQENGAAVQIYGWRNSKAQQFKFERQEDGSYVILNAGSGKALDVSNANAFAGNSIIQWSNNGGKNQRWFIRDTGNGYILQSALGPWVIDINAGNVSNGTQITLYRPNDGMNQRFLFASVNEIDESGLYRLSTLLDKNLVLDVFNQSKEDEARLGLWTWHEGVGQIYSFKQVGNGVYTITSINSNKVVDVRFGSLVNGSVIQQYRNTNGVNQHWNLLKKDGGYSLVSSQSGQYLDVPNQAAHVGAMVQTWQNSSTNAQKWAIEKVSEAVSFAYRHRNDLADGVYTLAANRSKNLVLDVNGASSIPGANVQIWAKNGGKNQNWRITHDALGFVTLTNLNSNQRLDVQNNSDVSGTNVIQWESLDQKNQQWIPIKNMDGSYTFVSAMNTRRALDMQYGLYASGTNVELWQVTGGEPQRWILEKQ